MFGVGRTGAQGRLIDTLEQLATYTKQEIAALHGVGPSVLRILETAL